MDVIPNQETAVTLTCCPVCQQSIMLYVKVRPHIPKDGVSVNRHTGEKYTANVQVTANMVGARVEHTCGT